MAQVFVILIHGKHGTVYLPYMDNTFAVDDHEPLLLTWFNFNLIMDK